MNHYNTLNTYFKSIKGIPLLTHQQEIELAKRIEKGDIAAKKKMIRSNLRLAISVVKKYAKYGANIEDLIQESNLGLIKAVEKFDWRKGFKFSTYATWWIKQAATRYLTANNSILNVPSHTIALSRKVLSTMKEYQEEFNSDPTVEELSDLLQVSQKHVLQALESLKTRHISSIDMPTSDENSRTLADVIPDKAESIETLMDNEILKKNIVKAFKSLSKREEIVLRLRFGISEVLDDDKNIVTINEEKVNVNA
jgi:RNA polymerase primary sigma factor